MSKDGTQVLWPQPSDDPEDPQNVGITILDLHNILFDRDYVIQWSDFEKNIQLLVVTLAYKIPEAVCLWTRVNKRGIIRDRRKVLSALLMHRLEGCQPHIIDCNAVALSRFWCVSRSSFYNALF